MEPDDLPLRASSPTLSLFITQPNKGARSFRLWLLSEALLMARAPEKRTLLTRLRLPFWART